jgi:hypothetical protein
MEFQMRNKTFISSMVGVAAAVAVAGSANAAVVWQTFDSLATAANAGAVSSTAPNTTFLSAQSSVSITADSWSSNRFLVATEAQSRMQITSSTAIFTSGMGPNNVVNIPGVGPFTYPGNPGSARIEYQSFGTRNLAGFQFRLNVTGVTNGGGSLTATLSDGVNIFALTNSVSANGYQTFDFSSQAGLSAINYIAFEFVGANATFGATRSVTVSGIQYVPAPGALALLGAAGLFGARRRRA